MDPETPASPVRAPQPARTRTTRKVVVFQPPHADLLANLRTPVAEAALSRAEVDARAVAVLERIENAARTRRLGVFQGSWRATGEVAAIVVEALPHVPLRDGATPIRALGELPVPVATEADWEVVKAKLDRLGSLAEAGRLELMIHAPRAGSGERNFAFAALFSDDGGRIEVNYLARLLVHEEEASQWTL